MNLQNTTILLTGGTGFLGHHTAWELIRKGADVRLLVQPHEKTWRLSAIGQDVPIVRADLLNPEALRTVLAEVRPAAIIHFAGIMERRRDLSIWDNLSANHVQATVNLVRAIDPSVTKLMVNTGTSEEYGEQSDPFVETMAVDPVSPYSATKAAATALVTYLSKSIGVPVVTMRPFIVFGPGQLHDTLIPFLIKQVLLKKPADLTEGLQYRDFLYVADLVSGYLAALENSESFQGPEIFNMGSGRPTTVREVIQTISDILDGGDYLRIGARPMRAGEAPSMIADISKAKRLLGWQPTWNLRDGLKKTIDWWLDHKEFWTE